MAQPSPGPPFCRVDQRSHCGPAPPFGVGTSTTLGLIAQRRPDALVVDPEDLGHMLWKQLPADLRHEEFELEPLWPPLTRRMLDQATRHTTAAPLSSP